MNNNDNNNDNHKTSEQINIDSITINNKRTTVKFHLNVQVINFRHDIKYTQTIK